MKDSFSCVLNAWRANENELRGYLTHRLGDSHLAEDLLQETFVKAMHQGKDFCRLDNARAWLFQVVRNALVDHHRLHKETMDVSEDMPAPEIQSEPLVALSACVARVLTELAPQDRDVIEQCDLNNMKQQDYAKLHGLSLAATKSRLLRARARMGATLSTNCKVEFDPEGRVIGHVPRK